MKYLIILLAALYSGIASSAIITFERMGIQGYQVKGTFGYNDLLDGTGLIQETDLDFFSIEGFKSGKSIGTWSMFDTLSPDSNPFNFNFRSDLVDNQLVFKFIYGGSYPTEFTRGSATHIHWGDKANNFAVVSGNSQAGIFHDGMFRAGHTVQDNGRQFRITDVKFSVPEPGTLALLAFGLMGLVVARRSSNSH